MYYNTTNEKGENLKEVKRKTLNQDEKILELFKVSGKLSASLINPHMNCPITSIRRSLNTLETLRKIHKTDTKIFGNYGRKEYLYTINSSYS